MHLPALLRFLFLVPLAATALAPPTEALQDYEKVKRKTLIDAASRHLELGSWCRDRGMTAQATAEFLAAVEVSEGAHPGAIRLVSIMRSLDERFWKEGKKPSTSSIKNYAKKARKLRLEDQGDRLDLAELADRKGMADIAEKEYEGILRRRDAALEFDKRGRLTVDAGTIPEDYARRFKEQAVAINDKLYLREGILAHVPDLKSIQEYQDEALRVRGSLALADLQDLHALTLALFPHLEEDLSARPTEQLRLFFFEKRDHYESYCEASGNADHKVVPGFAMRRGLTAAICVEDLDGETLKAVTLHEAAHLFQFATTRAVMPSWYSEGYAETFGAQGSFTWDGKELEVGGSMASFRLAPLKDPDKRLALEELLRSDALSLVALDRDRAHLFYTQAWTFLRFLREGAAEEVRDSFRLWESRCLGAALGAQAGQPGAEDAREANSWFRSIVAEDLNQLERDYLAWLETQLP